MSGTVSDFDQLVSMGFPPEKVEQALKATGGLQTAMDWLLAHADQDVSASGQPLGAQPSLETSAPAPNAEEKTKESEDGEIVEGEQTAQSLQCNDCQKLFRDSNAAERHAIKSGHVNFSESTTAIKNLTPEEKAAKLDEIRKKLSERREQRLLVEQEEERSREKIRRKSGKDMTEIKEKLEVREMEKALLLKKKEKEEERKARAKIKAQIEADKRERIEKREAAKQSLQQQTETASTTTSTPTPGVKKEYTETRLQIRQMSGSPLTHTFQASDTLKTVYEYAEQHIDGSFKLSTTFPRKVLDRDLFDKTLKELDLVPSGVLMVTF